MRCYAAYNRARVHKTVHPCAPPNTTSSEWYFQDYSVETASFTGALSTPYVPESYSIIIGILAKNSSQRYMNYKHHNWIDRGTVVVVLE